MNRLRSIQVLRALAVTAVVYSHAFASDRGSSGVDLFFVISGYIMARVSGDRSPLEFAKARVWRIYPLYLLAIAPYVAWQMADPEMAPRILATLSLWPIWAGHYQTPLLPVAWSLYFEMLFYAALTLWLLNRRAAVLIAAAIVAVALIRPGQATHYLLSPIILEFVAGYALAKLQRFPAAALALALGALLLFGPDQSFEAQTMLDAGQAGIRLMTFGIPAVLVVYGTLGLERSFSGRWADPLVLIGDASYSIYLTHLMPLHALGDWTPPARLAVAMLLGVVVHAFVERPLGAWGSGRKARRREPRSAAAAIAPPLPIEG